MSRSADHIKRMGLLADSMHARQVALHAEWSGRRRNLMQELGPIVGIGTIVDLPGKSGRVIKTDLPDGESRFLTYRYRVEYRRGESWAEIWIDEEDLVISNKQINTVAPRTKAVPKRDTVVTAHDLSNLDEFLADLRRS